MSNEEFKRCPSCQIWFSVDDIMNNPDIKPKGMTFQDSTLESTLFFFDHACENCGTTFVIPIVRFKPFIREPIPDPILAGSDQCEGHCLSMEDLEVCQSECRNAPFRRFLVSLLEKKNQQVPS